MESVKSEILGMIPEGIRDGILAQAALYGGHLQEIRLYRGRNTAIVCLGQMIRLEEICSEKEFYAVLLRLCGNSFYVHGDTMRDGYICTSGGVRVGVCGRAVSSGGKIERITDITSLCIRLPTVVQGTADDLLPYIFRGGGVSGMLIWSPPGVGKTTVLRELIRAVSVREPAVRAVVIDTRHEITMGGSFGCIDVLLGYPRSVGMEIAVRTMAPQIVICDEIAGQADTEAILACASSGAAVIATAHAGCRRDLMRRPDIRSLAEQGVFPIWTELRRDNGSVRHILTSGPVNTG